jgi:hypothetical protein
MSYTVRHSQAMAPRTPRTFNAQSIYLEPRKAELLADLAAETRIVKAVLLREAVDDLLTKYKKLRPKRKP